MTGNRAAGRYLTWLRTRGAGWTGLRLASAVSHRISAAIDRQLLAVEHDRLITGPGTLASHGNTVAANRALWESWDWSRDGEEWTDHARDRGLDPEQWRQTLIDRVLLPNVPKGAELLEIGPGAGRWSGVLADRAKRLVLGDISQLCLDMCASRLDDRDNVDYVLLPGDGRLPIADASIDAVWSYDVFVHINPTDTATYLAEFARVLRPGGRAVIHHSGRWVRSDGFRSHMDGDVFAGLASRAQLDVVTQSAEFVHKDGDLLTVLRKPLA